MFREILEMKKLTLTLFAVVMMAFASQAKADIVMDTYNNGAPVGGYWAFGPIAGIVGIEDYVADQTILANVATAGGIGNFSLMQIDSFMYVGGSQLANDVINFDFYDSSSVLQNSFNYSNGANVGNFIWTIALTDFWVPTSGFIEMSVGGTGQWFFTDPAGNLIVGDSPLNPDGLPAVAAATGPANYAFRFNAIDAVPEPSAIALLALVGVGLVVRRRRA
jgi:hypothetical protein